MAPTFANTGKSLQAVLATCAKCLNLPRTGPGVHDHLTPLLIAVEKEIVAAGTT